MDAEAASPPQILKLFVVGNSEQSRAALRNLKLIVAEFLPTGSVIQVVDLEREPEQAEEYGVLAVPMLMRAEPLPVRRIIGDLSDRERVLISLGALHLTL